MGVDFGGMKSHFIDVIHGHSMSAGKSGGDAGGSAAAAEVQHATIAE